MAEITDTIREVETKVLPTGTTIYLIKGSDGKEYSTKDRSLAQEAFRTVGQLGCIEFTEKRNGNFINRYVNHFAPVVGGQGSAQIAGQVTPPGLFDDTEPPLGGFELPAGLGQALNAEMGVGVDRGAEKDLAIAKAVALKAGVEILQYLPEEQRTVASVTGAAEYFTHWLTEWRP